ncbi:hypothetical protein P8452_66109 [Trifolium repens]|nr:pathogen-associated molecular patterns-induced protein A70 [Trifolium repens]WJX83447.1 hypothetical protein P8452_66109 [Trifolium repens]
MFKVLMLKKSASGKECSMTFDWEEEEDEETLERRRPAMVRSETTTCKEDESVDSKADDFINMFKKLLRLQRLDSSFHQGQYSVRVILSFHVTFA